MVKLKSLAVKQKLKLKSCRSMVTTEVSTAVSGMKPTSPPPESDGSTDFLDNDWLKESFSSGSLDFDDWTLLISEVETSFPDDIEKLCLVYDAFLLEFPLCHGYWRKYAYHKIQLCTLDDAVDVFERAIQAATYSLDVWLDYCTFAVAAYEDPHDGTLICWERLFLLRSLGQYIEFLLGKKQWSSLAHVYIRTLRYPSKNLHFYYKNFRKIAASLKEKIKCRIDVNGDLSSDPMEEDLVPTPHSDEEISVVIRDFMGPSSSFAVAKALHAYLSIGEQFYQDSEQLKEKISCFETQIRRPYFHVKPLDTNQLDNWHKLLSFMRCLIPCANYTEFWFRYVDFVESNGGRELANFALARASQTLSRMNLLSIYLMHGSRNTLEMHLPLLLLCPDVARSLVLGNFEAAVTTYREALKKSLVGKENVETTALLYVQFSRLKYMITNSADEAAQILIEGNEKVPHCKLLLEELIRLMMMHGGSRQIDLLDPIIDKEISHQADSSGGLSAEDKENISNLYMERVDSTKRKDSTYQQTRHWQQSCFATRRKEDLPLNSDAVLSDYINTEPNMESHVEGTNSVADREKLCESQSDEDGERSREVSLPIQATPEPGFVAKQAHFSSSSADTVKSDAIEIQPSGFRSPQSHQNQEFIRQASRNRFQRRDFNQNHRDPKPSLTRETSPDVIFFSHTLAVGVLASRWLLRLETIAQSHRVCKPSVSALHTPWFNPSNAYPQAQTPGQHMSVASSDNPAAVQSSFSQIPQNQYQASAAQVQPSFAYPQSQVPPQHPVQSNDQLEGQVQSNEAYNQMWQQYYYYNYYYQQQQHSHSSCLNNHNHIRILTRTRSESRLKQYQAQAGTQHPHSVSQVEQFNTQHRAMNHKINGKFCSSNNTNNKVVSTSSNNGNSNSNSNISSLYSTTTTVARRSKGDEQRPSSVPQVSARASDVQKIGESGGREVEHSLTLPSPPYEFHESL
ncbi:hypothetical protein HID58_076277 [Brassica napus]|uniref:Pre-mRNA-processing factor 39 n=1 Tax=Brassica napus TaxID=3708 RepID=A0ABQ7YM16_BRANA|nr:hypothetical protein HID58_076277 [Brassica napus]